LQLLKKENLGDKNEERNIATKSTSQNSTDKNTSRNSSEIKKERHSSGFEAMINSLTWYEVQAATGLKQSVAAHTNIR
jgi:hypothetical protein